MSPTPGPAASPPASAATQGPGDFTRMFEAPVVQSPQVQFQPPQFQAPQFQPPPVQPPQFQPPQMQFQPPQFQAPPAPAPAPARGTNYLPLVLILAGLLVVAIVMVIYFARR